MSREYVQRRLAEIKAQHRVSPPEFRPPRPWRAIEGLTVYPSDWQPPKFALLTLEQIHRLPEVDKHCRRPGIYFLLFKENLQYIGSSQNMKQRLSTHRSEKKIGFDKATFFAVPWPWYLAIEALYIRHYNPPKNSDFCLTREATP